MQVSQVDDHLTHAVIGQQETEEMGVEDSAALMHILSTGLYTHPKLAVVREICCNGWDGHIFSMITDVPLQVELTQTQMTIRDFGPGIPHAKIRSVYGTYGKSTKRDDSKSTGGFGLGSKAPFAYIDSFEVVSRHDGVKTVYRVSKSSMALGGKPSINKIVAVPTDETGISVTFDIKPGDYPAFERHLKEVAMLGEIPMVLNQGEQLPMLPLMDSPTGYMINEFKGTLTDTINVRYGNVVYPIPRHEKYDEQYSYILRKLEGMGWQTRITFLAPPDSISIAPSREAIILSDATVKTIDTLLRSFDGKELKRGDETGKQVISHLVNETLHQEPVAEKMWQVFKSIEVSSKGKLPGIMHPAGMFSYTLRKARLHHIILNASSNVNIDEVYIKRLHKLAYSGRVPQKFMLEILKTLRRTGQKQVMVRGDIKQQSLLHKSLHRHVTLPIRLAVASEEKLTMDRVFYTDTWGRSHTPNLVNPRQLRIRSVEEVVAFGFKRVLLARNKTLINDFFDGLHRQAHNQGDYSRTSAHGWVVYLVPAHEPTQDIIREAFTKLGYEIHERIPARVIRTKEIDPNAPVAVKKPAKKRKTMISLTQAYNARASHWLLNTGREVNHKEPEKGVLDPVAFAVLNSKSDYPYQFHGLGTEKCRIITQIWGDQIAVVTSVQAEVLKAKGIPDVKAFVFNHADKTLSAKQDFRRYLAFKAQGAGKESLENKVINQLCVHEDLMKELGLRFAISAETALLVTFYENLDHWNDREKMPLCDAIKAKVKPSPKYQETVAKLHNSPWAKYIKLGVLAVELESVIPNSAEAELPYTILRNLLK
jgi:hypothetical protein